LSDYTINYTIIPAAPGHWTIGAETVRQDNGTTKQTEEWEIWGQVIAWAVPSDPTDRESDVLACTKSGWMSPYEGAPARDAGAVGWTERIVRTDDLPRYGIESLASAD
jgi:hypothetical protein